MKFAATLLFASAVTAASLTQHRRDAHTKRALARTSKPKMIANGPANSTKAQYSANWAGAIAITTDVSSVTATITVPSVSAGSAAGGVGTQSCASAWVGIDGDTCTTAILQAGVDFCFQDGVSSYDVWYEWYPDYAYDFDMTVSQGDVITMTVIATSNTAGTALIENQTTGQFATQTFNGNVQGALCRVNAEWIVEDFQEGSSLVALADFGTVTFNNASATAGGRTVHPATGYIFDIKQSGTVLTSCSTSSDEVTCTYL